MARKNSLLTGRNLEQDPAYREEPFCLTVGWVKDKKERETGQREKREGER